MDNRKLYIHELEHILKEKFQNLPLSEVGYSASDEANDFIFKNPLAFIFGLIFDQSILSVIAWESPFLLYKRLGHLNVKKIAEIRENDLKNIISQKKALHRYPSVVARYIIASCGVITTQFNANAANLWKTTSISDAKKNILMMSGVGEKKANLAILMLVRNMGVSFKDIHLLPFAMDVHLRKVIERSGMFNIGTKQGMAQTMQIFQEETSVFPALLGTVIWFIGRKYCQKEKPMCNLCPLNDYCKKINING